MGLTDGDKALVLNHVAGLMARGLPLAEALAIVVDGLPPGEARTSLSAVLTGLRRGEVPLDTQDPLLALLARAERAGASAMALAANGFEGEATAREEAKASANQLVMLLGILAFALALLRYAVTPMFSTLFEGVRVPAATSAVLTQLHWSAPLSLVALLAVVSQRHWLRANMPGVAGLHAASRMRLVAAGLRAGVPEGEVILWVDPSGSRDILTSHALRLEGRARALLKQLAASEGMPAALEAVATERESQSRRAFRRWHASAPSLLSALLLWFIGGTMVGLYLPIFAIAGAIK